MMAVESPILLNLLNTTYDEIMRESLFKGFFRETDHESFATTVNFTCLERDKV